MRPDLADIRLAEYVFAPHYAAPLVMTVTRAAPLLAAPAMEAETLGTLNTGDIFEALDIASGRVWGIAPGLGLVGYVDRHAVEIAGPAASNEQ